jgi:hypothetical protein
MKRQGGEVKCSAGGPHEDGSDSHDSYSRQTQPIVGIDKRLIDRSAHGHEYLWSVRGPLHIREGT